MPTRSTRSWHATRPRGSQPVSAAEIPAEEVAANGSAPARGNGHVNTSSHANGKGHANGHTNGNAQPPSRGKPRSRPSVRQLEYVEEFAGRLGMDAAQVEGLAQRLFAKPLAELSGGEVSGLIRALQEMHEGLVGSGGRLSTGRRVAQIWGHAPAAWFRAAWFRAAWFRAAWFRAAWFWAARPSQRRNLPKDLRGRASGRRRFGEAIAARSTSGRITARY